MGEPVEKKTAVKKSVLIDATVKASFDYLFRWYYPSPERRAKDLEEAVKEFNKFIRDHRSQDPITLEVVREYQDQCSVCDCEWETYKDEETGKEICAGCGAEIEKRSGGCSKE